MKKTFLLLAIILVCTIRLEPMTCSEEDNGTVYDYSIVSVTKTGPDEITVRIQVRYCPYCNPNHASNPGCTEFTHGFPPPFYPYQYWCGGLADGRYVAVRIKDSTGVVLGTQKLVCNPTNWPLDVILVRDFVFSGVSLVSGASITAEADVYCSWCGHWYPSPEGLEITPLKVCIDPGHSPKHPGYSPEGYPTEYQINKAVAEELKAKLEAAGYSVELTKPELEWSTVDRASWVNAECKPDIFVSLHCNSALSPEAEGTEVWIHNDEDSPEQAIKEHELGKRILHALSEEINSKLREGFGEDEWPCKEKENPWDGKTHECYKDPWDGGYWEGIPIIGGKCTVCGWRFGVTISPAVLVEMEFYSNPAKRDLMRQSSWQEAAAQGICRGIAGYFEWMGLTYTAKSPVDIIVTDPDGLAISKQSNEIPGATYVEIDLDGDGDLDDQIRIPDRKIGEYIITVIPEPDALPTDTYTMEVSLFGEPVVIAENVPISEIPDQPYQILSTETGIVLPTVPAAIDFDPDVLNLKSRGEWVTVCIELPEGYAASDIDVSTVELSEEDSFIATAEWGDVQGDVMMVKFDRSVLIEYLNGRTGEVTLTTSGEVADVNFKGTDIITVMPSEE